MPSPWRFEALGAPWEILTAAPLGAAERDRVTALIEDFDRTYSRFRSDSLVARLAETGGPLHLPPSARPMLELYDVLHRLTDGAVNPLIGASLSAVGYDAHYSLDRRTPVPHPAPPLRVLRRGPSGVSAPVGTWVDVGACGKGLLVDLVLEDIAAVLPGEHIVDASGDIRTNGRDVVGLEDPRSRDRVLGTVTLRDRALASSAPGRRAWGDGWHHVLDARTGMPAREVAASWAVADDAMTADGLATALFFAAPAVLRDVFAFEFVRLFADGRLEYSPDWPGEVFV